MLTDEDYPRLKRYVWHLAKKYKLPADYEPDDLVQDVLLCLHRGNFSFGKPGWMGYIQQAVFTRLVNWKRKNHRRAALSRVVFDSSGEDGDLMIDRIADPIEQDYDDDPDLDFLIEVTARGVEAVARRRGMTPAKLQSFIRRAKERHAARIA